MAQVFDLGNVVGPQGPKGDAGHQGPQGEYRRAGAQGRYGSNRPTGTKRR